MTADRQEFFDRLDWFDESHCAELDDQLAWAREKCPVVHTGFGGWQREQRSIPPPATHSICPTCAVDYRSHDDRPSA